MYRKVEAEFEKWRVSDHKKALFVTGARQTGKTYAIRKLGEKYKSFVEINFVTQPDAISIFDGALDAKNLIINLTAFTGQEFIPGETLIFFDEIQECPNARTAIKFLVEDGRFDYVESGSLLGVRYKTVKSYPVGFEHIITMYPMDFEEFCVANSVQQTVLDHLKECYEKKMPVSDVIHAKMITLFKFYIITGGMPEAVKCFLETQDIQKVVSIQTDILAVYRQDIGKYALDGKTRISRIFDNIPSQLNDKNRRFTLSALGKNARTRDYEDAFLWLVDAGVALLCYNITEPKAPLKLNEQASIFKLFLSDCGLLCAASMENVQYSILQGDLSVNMGSILENVFAEQLVANGFQLRYYNKHNVGELDFLVQKENKIVPIEIKSGTDYKKHKALDNVMTVAEWDLPAAVCFSGANVEITDKVTYLPWYMVMFFKEDKIKDMIVKADLSGLVD